MEQDRRPRNKPPHLRSMTKEASTHNEDKTVSKWCCENFMLKNEIRTLSNTTQNKIIHSKWIKDLNVKARCCKLARGKHRQNTEINHSDFGGDSSPRVMEIKTKIESAYRWRSCGRASGSILGLGRSPGKGNGNPLQYSCLGNPTDRGAWQATVHGVMKELDMA